MECQAKDCEAAAVDQTTYTKQHDIHLCGNHNGQFLDAYDRNTWKRDNTIPYKMCPNCEKNRKILDGDYVCAFCREELSAKWSIKVPEFTRSNLRKKELAELIAFCIEAEIGFETSPESS